MRILVVHTLAVLALVLSGCASKSSSPYATPTEADRDALTAQRLNDEAAELMDTDPERAEELLREALAADLFFGPAHNNLGVIHLKRGDLYAAASEFEWARKLMPGHPDPRTNLALTLETAGRIDEAMAEYETALEVYPNYLPTIQALCRCQLRYDQTDSRTDGFLEEVAMRGESEQWRTWARQQLIRRQGES